MNRKLFLSIICAASLCAAAWLVACNSHEHSYSAEVINATCTEGGYTKHTCACGDSYTDEETQPLGHNYVNTVTPPTCTEQGYTTHTCECGYSYTDGIKEPLGHDYAVSWTWDGFISATATFTCSHNEEHVERVTGNVTSADTTPATCTTEGVKTHTATVTFDGKQYTDKSEEILPAAHNLVNNVCVDCGYCAVGSQGLDMILNTDTNTYSVIGIGTCTDTEIFIPSIYNGKAVTVIEQNAFKNCNITSVTIGNGVTQIKAYAFSGCMQLTEITFSKSVKILSADCAEECNNLTNIKFNGDISDWCTLSGLQFLLVNSNQSEKNLFINGTKVEGEIIIPSDVTTISSYAFSHIGGITSARIESGVRLGNSSFKNCSSIESVTLDKDIDSIGSNVFVDCDNLNTVNYNGTVEQWNSISKGTNWHGSLSGLTVICTDGKLDKDGNPKT
ncbi:MAG: leucine-rich repeat domain-containing protein [Candidatus Coproplasma sp.]